MQYNAKDFNKFQKRTHTLTKHLQFSPHWQIKVNYKDHVRCILYFTLNKSEVVCLSYKDKSSPHV